MHTDIFTDGACSGNPGPGGYGVIVRTGSQERELSGGYSHTTNNRMELLGVIRGLETTSIGDTATVTTDSRYVVDSFSKGWAHKWRANKWKRNKKDYALNIDLWTALLELTDMRTVTFIWVKGHSDHEENERCDELARIAVADHDNWIDDENDII